jgi:hypothetical protein
LAGGWILEVLFDLLWSGAIDKVGRRAAPWVFALVLVGPLALLLALLLLLL